MSTDRTSRGSNHVKVSALALVYWSRESWKNRGHRYLQRWPGRRAIQRIRDGIKTITAPRHRLPEPVGPIVAEINQAVRGWGAYFRVGNSSRKFAQVDDYVRERLALFLSKKTGQHGRHFEQYTYAYFKRLGVYRLVGTVKWFAATPIATR